MGDRCKGSRNKTSEMLEDSSESPRAREGVLVLGNCSGLDPRLCVVPGGPGNPEVQWWDLKHF